MSNIIADLLDYLGVKHTNYFVNKLYHEHPHNEDMYGLKDMLRSYNIESVGVDIKDKDETNMYFPSIYHTADQFILALECNDKKVSYIMNGKLKHPPPIADTVTFNIPLKSLSPFIPQYAL